MVNAVRTQIAGAVLLTVGFGLWFGAVGAFICSGLCAIIGGAVAELGSDGTAVVDDYEGAEYAGSRSAD